MIRSLILMKLQVVGLRGARKSCRANSPAVWRAASRSPVPSCTTRCWRCTTSRSPAWTPISLNVIADLIRRLNDALGTTSIIVTYDVSESLKLVDYLYVIADGVVVGETR